MRRLKRNFFKKRTLMVAKGLLGKYLIRMIGDKKLVGKIVEVEAYNGPNDLASHASRGQTDRNKVMFGSAGFSYVYLIYGLNYCFNIVTENYGYPAAVLIRAVEPVNTPLIRGARGVNKVKKSTPLIPLIRGTIKLTNGPGKLCQAFKIDKKLNGVDLTKSKKLYLEDGGIKTKKADIVAAKRIGVDYAGKYKDKLWRFYIKDNKWVSKKCPS